MLQRYTLRVKEEDSFTYTVRIVNEDNDKIGKRKIAEFESKKKRVFNLLKLADTSAEDAQTMLEDLQSRNNTLHQELIEMEVNKHEAFKRVLDDFESTYRQISQDTLEEIQATFVVARTEENTYSEAIAVKINAEAEKYSEDSEKVLNNDALSKEDSERVQAVSPLIFCWQNFNITPRRFNILSYITLCI